jgi:hypothetical protein
MASFRFTLRTPDTIEVFGTEYVRNWDSISPSLTINDTYRTVLREFTSTIEFVGRIKTLIIDTIDSHGVDVGIYLLIEKGNDNHDRWSYSAIAEELKGDIKGHEREELSVSINFADTEFVAKIFDRDDIKTNLAITEGIDGKALTPIVYNNIFLHCRPLFFVNKGENELSENILNRGGLLINSFFITIPIDVVLADDENFGGVPSVMAFPTYGNDYPYSLYLISDKKRSVSISFSFTLDYKCNNSTTYKWNAKLINRNKKTIDGGSYKEVFYLAKSTSDTDAPYGTPTYPNMNTTFNTFSASFEGDVIVEEGGSLILAIEGDGLEASYADNIYITTKDLTIDLTSTEISDPVISKCALPFEMFSRLIAIYTGVEGAFYSTFFGRKEFGYAEDGEGAFLAIMTGEMIRNFPNDKYDFITSLKEAFEAFNCIFNLGVAIKMINNKQKFIIEKYDDIQNNDVVVKLSDFFNKMSMSVNPELVVSTIKIGYTDRSSEEFNGLFGFNGESNFVSPLNTEGHTLDLICKWITDDVVIELTRRLQYKDTSSKDYRTDKEIFIIDCKNEYELRYNSTTKTTEYCLIPKKDEDFESVTGIFEPSSTYNLNITPLRNLFRWGGYINGCLANYATDKLRVVKTPNNADLITKKIDQDFFIENGNVLISRLDRPKNTPYVFKVEETPLLDSEYEALKDNSGCLVEFNSNGIQLFGRIYNIDFDIIKKIANFELIKANY